jgi:hypothetical protein
LQLLEQLLRLWNIMIKIAHVVFGVPVFVNTGISCEAMLLSISQTGSYFARGCAVVNVIINIINIGCYGVLILHAVYVLGISL